jgi:hypothetical protein
MEGKTALGASSPAKPALHIPEPLSITNYNKKKKNKIKKKVLVFCRQKLKINKIESCNYLLISY